MAPVVMIRLWVIFFEVGSLGNRRFPKLTERGNHARACLNLWHLRTALFKRSRLNDTYLKS